MTIAIFASAFHPHIGGVEELCRQLAHACRDAGHECIVLTNRWPRSLPAYETFEGISLFRLAFRVPEGSVKARCSYALTHSSITRQMLSILRDRKVDVLHVQCVSSNGYYALLAKRRLGLPLVVTAQGELTMDAGKLYETSSFANQVLRELLTHGDYITACSTDTLKDLQRWYGQPLGDRATVIYNGIGLADFVHAKPFQHVHPYILGIGRLVPQKGFDVLLRAFAASNPPGLDLIVAGEGVERLGLESLASSLGIADRVVFHGRAARAEAVALFKGCAFFVLPSLMEPQGIVNLEAMAAGAAVVASNVGGVGEIVRDNETGILFPAGDCDALASALTRLASDPALRERLAANGQRVAGRFDWPIIARKYLAIYASVIAPPSSITNHMAGKAHIFG